jgi:signal transduction histidine kinase
MKQPIKMFVILMGLTILGTFAAGISLLYAWHMRTALDRSLTENLWKVMATADLDTALQRQKGLVASYLLDRGSRKWLHELPHLEAEFRLTLDKMLKDCRIDAECSMVREIKEAYEAYDGVREKVVALYERGSREEGTNLYLKQIGAQYAQVAALTSKLSSYEEVGLENAFKRSNEGVWRLTFFVIASATLTAILGGALIRLLFVRLYRPLRELAVTAESLTSGEGNKASSRGEDDLKALERSLQTLVSDLSGTRADLEAARKKLEHSERLASVGNAVAQLLHDIKNRVLVVGLYVTSIARGADNAERTREHSSVVLDEIRKLEKTLRDIRDFSKPLALNMETTSLNALLEKTLDRQIELLPAAISIERDLHVDIPDLLLDRERIEQVIINLIRNSLEALGSKGKIRIATRRAEGNKVILTVEDDGPGIPEHRRDKIFTPFFTTKTTGNGLGLPICKEIVAAHGGSIRLDPDVASGARFEVYFPAPGGLS